MRWIELWCPELKKFGCRAQQRLLCAPHRLLGSLGTIEQETNGLHQPPKLHHFRPDMQLNCKAVQSHGVAAYVWSFIGL